MQQSNSKREVHRNAGLHQERKISNKQFNFTLKKTRKKGQSPKLIGS